MRQLAPWRSALLVAAVLLGAALIARTAPEAATPPPTPAHAPPPAGAAAAARTAPAETRRVAVRAENGVVSAPEIERLSGWARRQGIRLEMAGESVPVPAGWEVLRIAVAPASPDFSRRLSRFGVRTEPVGFVFDGRAYTSAQDAIAVRDPAAPRETLLLANGRPAVLRLAGRRIFPREGPETDYQVVSGDLGKSGRFRTAGGALSVDRTSDRDEIRAREDLLRSFTTVERGGVRWRFAPADAAAVARWEPVLARFLRKLARVPLAVRLFPDPATKGRLTGSSRPADVVSENDEIRVDLDISAPPEPDLISPVIAAAAYAAESPRLLARPVLLLALGARSAGRWWGRDVAPFATFAGLAQAGIRVQEAMGADEEVSPVIAVGSASAWIDAGIRSEGEGAVLQALGGADPPLEAALRRWETLAVRVPTSPPARRPLPAGFLRGVSYAMSNSIDAGYASPRSRDSLARLARIGANAVSVMPFGFAREADRPTLSFVHRHPQGETDEGTVRAVTDARALGMTAMVKPQIWVGNDVFVGNLAMRSEEDWKRWFGLYRRFLVHNAIVAEAAGAALFCVGTELMGTEARTAEWREAIAAVRLATGAPLTYAANWTGGAIRVPFWDALDVIGVDFYDPPSTDPEATDAGLEAGVKAAARPLAALSQRTGKPVLFTEAGFPLCRAAWIAPHDENTGRPPASADAARAIAAIYRALEKEPWWKGVYWWKAFSSGREARPDDRGFNVLGGAPEKAVAEGFERVARARSVR